MKTLSDVDKSWPPLEEDLRFLRCTKRWSGGKIADFYGVSRGAVSGMLARCKISSPKCAAGRYRADGPPIASDCPAVALDDGTYMEQVRRLNLPPPPNCEIIVKHPRALPVRPPAVSPWSAGYTYAEGL